MTWSADSSNADTILEVTSLTLFQVYKSYYYVHQTRHLAVGKQAVQAKYVNI